MTRAEPNFFIVGAPKCGTTSLARWMDKHPLVHMAKPKEPMFFNKDIGPHHVDTWEEYLAWFGDVPETVEVVGDASTSYLRSEVAVPNILERLPDAKFVAMVRNPVELAQSWHNEMIRGFVEDLTDFEEAWKAQEDRARGARIPDGCKHPELLAYRDVASIGSQIRRFLARVPSGHALVIVMDDLAVDPRKEYLRVLDFLGLPDSGELDFTPQNQRAEWRSGFVRRALQRLMKVKRRLGITGRTGLLDPIVQWNRKRVDTSAPDRIIRMLGAAFADEIAILSEELDRDFSHWLVS